MSVVPECQCSYCSVPHRSPGRGAESLEQFVLVCQVFLNLFPHVEDGTISTEMKSLIILKNLTRFQQQFFFKGNSTQKTREGKKVYAFNNFPDPQY